VKLKNIIENDSENSDSKDSGTKFADYEKLPVMKQEG